MTNKHTPGPWAYDMSECSDGSPYAEIHPDGCSGWKDGRYLSVSGPIAESDARLIAAAPELLDIAQSILADDMLQYLPAEYIAKVRSVIAKATGQ